MKTSPPPPPPVRPKLSVLPPPKSPVQFISSAAKVGDSVRLILAGELDLSVRNRFDADVAEVQGRSGRVLLDLRSLTFIDCACLAVLFAAGKRARREQAALILLGPSGQVRRLLDLVGPPPGVTVLEHGDLHEHRAPVAA